MTRVQNGRARSNGARKVRTNVWGIFPGLAPKIGQDSTIGFASMNRTLHRIPAAFPSKNEMRKLIFYQSSSQVASRPPRGGR